MPNLFTGAVPAANPTKVQVGVASTPVLPINRDRAGLILINLGTTISIGIGASASLGQGITLAENGVWNMGEYDYTIMAIEAIATSTGNISIQEFNRGD